VAGTCVGRANGKNNSARSANPPNPRAGNDHQMITQIFNPGRRQEWPKQRGRLLGRGRFRFYANHACVFIKRQNRPVAEIAVASNQHTRVSAREREDFGVIRAGFHHFGRGDDVVPFASQDFREIQMKHLVEKEAHGLGRSGRGGRENVGVLDGRAGVEQRGLNILPREPRIAAEQVVPGFARRHLLHEQLHGNTRAANYRLSIANARVEFDAVEELTHKQTLAYLDLFRGLEICGDSRVQEICGSILMRHAAALNTTLRDRWRRGKSVHMRIAEDPRVERQQRTAQDARGGDDDLVGRIAMKRTRQLRGFDSNPRGECQELNAGICERQVEPLTHRAGEGHAIQLDQLRDLPTGAGRRKQTASFTAGATETLSVAREAGQPRLIHFLPLLDINLGNDTNADPALPRIQIVPQRGWQTRVTVNPPKPDVGIENNHRLCCRLPVVLCDRGKRTDILQRFSAQRVALLPRCRRRTRHYHHLHTIPGVHRKVTQDDHALLGAGGFNMKRSHENRIIPHLPSSKRALAGIHRRLAVAEMAEGNLTPDYPARLRRNRS